jgi:hypothetical protein
MDESDCSRATSEAVADLRATRRLDASTCSGFGASGPRFSKGFGATQEHGDELDQDLVAESRSQMLNGGGAAVERHALPPTGLSAWVKSVSMPSVTE